MHDVLEKWQGGASCPRIMGWGGGGGGGGGEGGHPCPRIIGRGCLKYYTWGVPDFLGCKISCDILLKSRTKPCGPMH